MKLFKKIYPYLFILPAYLIICFVYFYPLANVFRSSFYRFSGGELIFVKFQNYAYLLFRDLNFKLAITNNLKFLIVIPCLLFLSLLAAYAFNEGVRGGRFYQIIIFLPKVISIVVVGVVFSFILRVDGILNKFFELLNLDFLTQDWLGNYKLAIYSIMGTLVWKELGFGFILFLARMTTLNPSITEAAKVDGANWFQRFIYVVIPQIKGFINFYIIINVTMVFAWIFPYVFTITKGGPGNITTIIEREILLFAFDRNQLGIGSALSVMLFLGVFIFIYLQSRLSVRMMED